MKYAPPRTIRIALTLAFVCLVLASFAGAQTVRPLINELGNPAKGRIEYVNDASVPLNVVVEARSFSVSEKGDISYSPLDTKRIHLKLSATSFRIPPQQSYYLFYEASTDTAPAWFVIYAAFSGFGIKTADGMNVRVQLPHTVYLLPKSQLEKTDVHVVSASFDPATKKITLLTENSGPNFGRVMTVSLAAGKKKQEGSGFPVFPQSRREMEYTWEGDQPPDKVVLDLDRFKVESEVTRNP